MKERPQKTATTTTTKKKKKNTPAPTVTRKPNQRSCVMHRGELSESYLPQKKKARQK
jgi:hypothetical protein